MQASEPNADEIDVPVAVDLHRDLQACTLGTYTGCTTAGAAGTASILAGNAMQASFLVHVFVLEMPHCFNIF
jgi:hypothetical protein